MSTLILAHRGDHRTYPENSQEAFKSALELGADGLELDVHLSSDGELVVFHDFNLKELTGEDGLIGQYTYDMLSKLKVRGQSRIPTLKEVLLLIAEHQKLRPDFPIVLNVELKAGSQLYPGIEVAVYGLCNAFLAQEQVIYSSFDHQAMRLLKTYAPKAQVGLLTTAALIEPWVYVAHAGADFYHPHYLALSKENFMGLMQAGVRLNTYTLNDPIVAKALIQGGIHAIITDDVPGMLAAKGEAAL